MAARRIVCVALATAPQAHGLDSRVPLSHGSRAPLDFSELSRPSQRQLAYKNMHKRQQTRIDADIDLEAAIIPAEIGFPFLHNHL
jgi:hypothetical protein